eukprot:Em0012g1081a
MRRIIAEDPEWNLETVPPLVDACIQHIADHFHGTCTLLFQASLNLHYISAPNSGGTATKHKKMVLEKLSPSVPLKYAQTLYIAPSKLTAPSCRVTSHLVSDEDYWKKCCTTRWGNCDVSKYGKCWKRMFFEKNAQEALEKFVPDQSDLSEDEEQSEDTPLKPCNDHINTGILFQTLKNLEELGLAYGVKNCGMNFDWGLFEFTKLDCARLSKAVGSSRTLQHGRGSNWPRPTDQHYTQTPKPSALNKLGDEGAQPIFKALMKNMTLQSLNISSNSIGDIAAPMLAEVLIANKTLTSLSIASNTLGEVATTAVSNQTSVFPVAAIICVVIAGVVIIVVLLLVVRKCLILRGVTCPKYKLDCFQCDTRDCSCCRDLAERLDCRTPDCRVYLDQVCPTKQQCTLLCGQIWNCYYCFILVDYCKTLDICPNAGALHCPDFTCPGCGCHCALRMPECSHISCLCFECGRPES